MKWEILEFMEREFIYMESSKDSMSHRWRSLWMLPFTRWPGWLVDFFWILLVLHIVRLAETRIFHPGKKHTHTICWCLVVTSTILLFHSFQDPLGKVAGSHTKKSRKRRKTQIKDSLLTPEESWNQKNKMKIQWHRGTAYSNKVKLTETSFTNSVFDTLFSLFLYVII